MLPERDKNTHPGFVRMRNVNGHYVVCKIMSTLPPPP